MKLKRGRYSRFFTKLLDAPDISSNIKLIMEEIKKILIMNQPNPEKK